VWKRQKAKNKEEEEVKVLSQVLPVGIIYLSFLKNNDKKKKTHMGSLQSLALLSFCFNSRLMFRCFLLFSLLFFSFSFVCESFSIHFLMMEREGCGFYHVRRRRSIRKAGEAELLYSRLYFPLFLRSNPSQFGLQFEKQYSR